MTLAWQFAEEHKTAYFDLELQPDRQRLENPQLMLGNSEGLADLDEIHEMPELFKALRVLVDRLTSQVRCIKVGSVSPQMVKRVSETFERAVEQSKA